MSTVIKAVLLSLLAYSCLLVEGKSALSAAFASKQSKCFECRAIAVSVFVDFCRRVLLVVDADSSDAQHA